MIKKLFHNHPVLLRWLCDCTAKKSLCISGKCPGQLFLSLSVILSLIQYYSVYHVSVWGEMWRDELEGRTPTCLMMLNLKIHRSFSRLKTRHDCICDYISMSKQIYVLIYQLWTPRQLFVLFSLIWEEWRDCIHGDSGRNCNTDIIQKMAVWHSQIYFSVTL